MHLGLHVKCPTFLSSSNQILIFSTDFQKCIWPVGAALIQDGRTDMTKVKALFASM